MKMDVNEHNVNIITAKQSTIFSLNGRGIERSTYNLLQKSMTKEEIQEKRCKRGKEGQKEERKTSDQFHNIDLQTQRQLCIGIDRDKTDERTNKKNDTPPKKV